ncbi:MAG: flavin reductase family protein [Pseudomonadota bacterium]|nr:flavin reductase family protein [Pseudomonadota bacterium]
MFEGRQRLQARARRFLSRFGRGPTAFMRVAYQVPRQVVLVTASHAGERALWPVDWHMPVGFEPPRYALAFGRDAHGTKLLLRAGCFVVNTIPAELEPIILEAGRRSGHDGDKLDALGLSTSPALFVEAPCLVAAIGRLECTVEDAREWGDRVLVVGRVQHAEEAPRDTATLHHEWRR